jgi:hypothetical protein
MPVFMRRWPNGDVSFLSARNRDDAIIALDELDNAELAELSQVRDFGHENGATGHRSLLWRRVAVGSERDIFLNPPGAAPQDSWPHRRADLLAPSAEESNHKVWQEISKALVRQRLFQTHV